MSISEYAKKNFDNVRIIGVVNPSVIVVVNGVSFTIYRVRHGNKGWNYVACQGENRHYFNELSEIKKIIK